MNERTALYRAFAGERLVYIGISDGVLRRMHQHATTKRWWTEITRIDMEWHATREDAALAEAQAIVAEGPQWNIIHAERLRDDFFLLPHQEAVDRLVDEVASTGRHHRSAA